MKCGNCGDSVSTVGQVRACKTCREDGTANEMNACSGIDAVSTAILLKPALANRFSPEPEPTPVHTEQAAIEAAYAGNDTALGADAEPHGWTAIANRILEAHALTDEEKEELRRAREEDAKIAEAERVKRELISADQQ